MHRTLYRKWRPSTFSEVVGQDHVTSVLKYEVANGKTTHAYLFCGSRGTGKTSCAKILAKAINCLHPEDGNPCGKCEACRSIENGSATDVTEMDAASNNGVDDIRLIRDEVVYAPAELKKRVYIIDEVHMLSQAAFNALLKTLEEPPEHVVFILATTETHKIPATILSRCQRFDFRRISIADIAARLKYIAENEKISLTDDAASLIARFARGGLRDAIGLLELCAADGGNVDAASVRNAVGAAGSETVSAAVSAVADKDFEKIFEIVDEIYSSSADISVFWRDLAEFCRDMIVVKSTWTPEKYLDMTKEEFASVKELASRFSIERIVYFSGVLQDAYAKMQKDAASSRMCAEMTLVGMCDAALSQSAEALAIRIGELEDRVASLCAGTVEKAFETRPVPETRTPKSDIGKTSDGERAGDGTVPEKNAKKSDDAARGGQSGLVRVDGWQEIVRIVDREDSGAASMLKNAKALVSDGSRILIRTDNEFSKMLLDSEIVRDIIARAVNSVNPSIGTTKAEISVEVVKRVSDDDDPINEIK